MRETGSDASEDEVVSQGDGGSARQAEASGVSGAPGTSDAVQDSAAGDTEDVDSFEDDFDDAPFDWVVFALRAAAFVTFGAMLVTSIDFSLNQGWDWMTTMRVSILPFVGGMLLLAAGELIDRQGD